MKILAINAFHYRRGGSETVYFNTSDILRSHGHEVVEYALKWPDNIPSRHSHLFAESKETRSGLLGKLKNIPNYFYHSEAAANLEALIKAEKPDVAQIHLIWGQLTPSILKVLRRHNIPVVLTLHDFRLVCPASVMRNGKGQVCEECKGHLFYRCIANKCCKGSRGLSVMMAAEQYFRNALFHPASLIDGLLYVSDYSRRKHEEYMPALKKIPWSRIYNTSPAIMASPGQPARQPYYLYFGRISHEKGIPTLVEAFAKLPHLKLKIVGSGPLAKEIESIITERKLDNIEMLGFRSGKELTEIVERARFVIQPSECYENNPLTIIEAYSCGTPVIGAEIGGIPEIVPVGITGFLFPAGNAKALADMVEKSADISEAEYSKMQQNAHDFARRNFDPHNYYSSLMNLYDKAIKHHFSHNKSKN